MSKARRSAAVALGLAAFVLAACMSAGQGSVIDGWPIGEALDCRAFEECEALKQAALEGLDQRDPGHAAITSITLHREGALVNESGEVVLTTRSGGPIDVAVITLADGSVRAIGLKSSIGSVHAVPYGP